MKIRVELINGTLYPVRKGVTRTPSGWQVRMPCLRSSVFFGVGKYVTLEAALRAATRFADSRDPANALGVYRRTELQLRIGHKGGTVSEALAGLASYLERVSIPADVDSSFCKPAEHVG